MKKREIYSSLCRCIDCENIFAVTAKGVFPFRCRLCEHEENQRVRQLVPRSREFYRRKDRTHIFVGSLPWIAHARRRLRRFRPYNAVAVLIRENGVHYILRYREPGTKIYRNKGVVQVSATASDTVRQLVFELVQEYAEKKGNADG